MTLDAAIQRFRSLSWSASEGWPMGEPPDLRDQCREALEAIDAHLHGLPATEQRAAGATIRRRIEAREHVATVAPRRHPAPGGLRGAPEAIR